MKNVVECPREFIALETICDFSPLIERVLARVSTGASRLVRFQVPDRMLEYFVTTLTVYSTLSA